MSRRNALLILTFLLLALTTLNVSLDALVVESVEANPKTIIVPTKDYRTIQDAINKANESDTILVMPGRYHEHINVTKSIKLKGGNPLTTIIDGDEENQTIVKITASNVEIRDFTIENGSKYYVYGDYGIKVWSSVNVTIRNNIIRKTSLGIWLSSSNNCSIINNTIMDNYKYGIQFSDSCSNLVVGNNITNNPTGIWITSTNSQRNVLHHNNFVDNPTQMTSWGSATHWDNGAEGNYWSDYTGVDVKSGPNQDESGSDGIGDTPYPDELDRRDKYPLMGPIYRFDTGVWNGITYYVNIVSNAVVSSFNFNPEEAFISFIVNSSDGTTGFCRVTIPEELLWVDVPEEWQVFMNGTPVSYSVWTIATTENAIYTSIYFTYSHSTQNVQIKGVHAIPEFPTALPVLIFMVAIFVLTVFVKRRSRMDLVEDLER